MVVEVTGGSIHKELIEINESSIHIRIPFRPMKLTHQVTLVIVWASLQKKEPNVKDIMVRVAADLLKVDMLVGIMELIQKEKQLYLVAK